MANRIMALSVAAGIGFSLTLGSIKMRTSEQSKQKEIHYAAVPHAEAKHVPHVKQEVKKQAVILDVPLYNQMDSPRLYNGCEITSLAMIINYEGIGVSKNKLAEEIKRVPLRYSGGEYGNPNEGFVGNMEDGPGLGVYQGPIFELAKKYFPDRAENLTGKPFDVLLEKVAEGSPVWIITTASLSPSASFETWNTPGGPVDVTFQMHSVAITGYDEGNIYINDPYGTKNKKVPKQQFIEAWELMGSQAIVIN
ncbi:hydrolase [Sporosarcina globispora]|uniref:Hydrolase n=1 Tax=Sporosarcina globispora TaxID=1459 RepID=A0A0M0GEM7_SPOGL|nr:C39 family peptidase [Sporosarcina globispora]KON88370.1 hydrolase [Sporosarcina globispora]